MARVASAFQLLWERVPAPLVDRGVGLLLAGPGATVLLLARWLVPSSAGMGTHLQLGLSPCVMLSLTGFPCPMCGMTTTFALMADGDLGRALVNQPFGVVLFLCTVAATGLGLADLILGRGLWRRALKWVEARESAIAILLLVGMTLGWIYKSCIVRGIFA